MDEAQTFVTTLIRDFARSAENSLKSREAEPGWAGEPAWDEPLVGFSSGADPIYAAFKEHVGEFHWSPAEAFAKAFPEDQARPEELTVISWILPQTEATHQDQKTQTRLPAERWIRSRIFGELFNEALRRHVAAALEAAERPAAAPALSPAFKIVPSERFYLASTWSERHAAFASGLGTFGLCDGLITPRGKAMRTGSVVVRWQIAPTARPYQDPHAYCLHYTHDACRECIQRCPAGALSREGHDKRRCNAYIQGQVVPYTKEHFGFPGRGGCGLCQTGVPCASKIPTMEDLAERAGR